MKTLLKLSIPQACPEKWGNFTTTSTGEFCSSCNRNVIDFTKMNDDTILQFFKDHPKHTCGRFRPGQLTSYPYNTAKINTGMLLLKAGILSLLLALISRPASAQEPVKSPATETTQSQSDNSTRETQSQKVRGIVKDENGDAMPGANIYLKGTSVGTSANADGSFEFPKALTQGDILVFSFIGFESKEYMIPAKRTEDLDITLALDTALTLGEVSVEQVYTSKNGLHNFWAKLRDIF